MSALDPLVLLVEDEPAVRRFVRAALEANHYRLLEASTSAEAVQLATGHNPDLILLDLGLPDGDGIDLTRRLREWTKTPVLVISARGREEDKVNALDAGADDYLTKPFGVGELLARMRVALRHAERIAAPSGQQVFTMGTVALDATKRVVTKDGEEVRLTPTEYKLLLLLLQNAGKVLTHRQILREVWGPSGALHPHHVRVHMAELRKKVEVEPARPRYLITEPGIGYRLRE
jgi:two-component system KDP operon response regulator KdpE